MPKNKIQVEHRKLTLVAVLTATCALVLILFTHNRLSDYQSYHSSLAQISTKTIADNISSFVIERQRLVALFANEHVSLIRNLADDPTNDDLHNKMRAKIRQYFPNHFAFTVTNPVGQAYFEDFDGLILDLCKDDINAFALEDIYSPYIHPHPNGYHFDVMARYGDDSNEGIIFISFQAEVLSSMLRNTEATDHTLMLIYPEKDHLIEVVTNGARVDLDRNNYHLNGDELSRVLHRSHINNTMWQAVDLYNIDLFYIYMAKLYLEAITIFSLIFIAIIWLVRSYLLNSKGLDIKQYDPRDVLLRRP